MAEETSKYPSFVTPKWVEEKLRISDDDAQKIAKKMATIDDGWDDVKDKSDFAESFLDAHMADPNVGYDCRSCLGKETPTIFTMPADKHVPPPAADTPAKKARGHFAECARSAAEDGNNKIAAELIMLEMLEYGEKARAAFEMAREVQSSKKYKNIVETAREIEERAKALALVDQGLYPIEATGEARAEVTRDYSIAKLSMLADKALDAEDKVKALEGVAAGLAEASGNAAAYLQISSAPLATLSAIAALRESVGMLEGMQEGAEDESLSKKAGESHAAAQKCKDHLVDRLEACKARLKAEAVADQAKKAASQVKEASEMPAKNMAEMKKVQEVFLKANEEAMEACTLATSCAKFISKLAEAKPNDQEAEEMFAQIEKAFAGAKATASKDVLERAKAAAEAQDQAKELSEQAMESVTEKKAAAKTEEEAPETSKEDARKELLAALKEFSSKRWDTNLATQTLKRLTDRRKEVIGQLWEAVENEDPKAPHLATKFVEQFTNSMDARRRLDAVVRLMGRGDNLDPRTSKWFIDGIMKLASAASVYQKASG